MAPTKEHQPFETVVFNGFTGTDSTAPITPYLLNATDGVAMQLNWNGHYFYITKTQAMDFFGITPLLKDIHTAITGGTDHAELNRLYPLLDQLIGEYL